ncbi:MAG TPA: response regulator [Vicinamibacteria bacterium]|nr:response regulator [Vicinamibacteria bacterium]
MSVRRVLVVDDDETTGELLEATLLDAGYDVAVAAGGAAGLELAERFKPHLVLLDLRMPGLDGRAFLEAYRRGRGRKAAVAVVTAVRDGAAVAARLGAQGVLEKPFDLSELLNLVARLARG